MAKKKQPTPDIAGQCIALAEFAASIMIAAEDMGMKQKVVEGLTLDPTERHVVAQLPMISSSLEKKLSKPETKFTVADCGEIIFGSVQSLCADEPLGGLALLFIVKKSMDQMLLTLGVPTSVKTRKTKLNNKVYQFKITLIDSEPLIWRRFQVQDCSLDKFHEHIQTAMGWTNSHLYQFQIKGKEYGDPELLDDDESLDSTSINLSQVLPKTGKKLTFLYLYDFGDGWEHELLFEGNPSVDDKAKYPLCLEGERACPPEDCGGVWGYGDFLEAIRDPKNEEHETALEWVGGRFDPEDFDPKQTTKAMRKGITRWRKDE